MKILVKNLGPIKQAELDLKDLTVICGENNTWKTYLVHSISNCFQYLKPTLIHPFLVKRNLEPLWIDKNAVQEFIDKKEYQFSIPISRIQNGFNQSIKNYVNKRISTDFASKNSLFSNTKIEFLFNLIPTTLPNKPIPFQYNYVNRITMRRFLLSFTIEKMINKNNKELQIQLLLNNEIDTSSDKSLISHFFNYINFRIDRVLCSCFFPNIFVISAERAGVSMFQPELDSTPSKLLDSSTETEDDDLERGNLLMEFKMSYPKSVRNNIDYVRFMQKQTNRESYLAKKHPEMLRDFNNILGGEYIETNEGVRFIPKNTDIALTLTESSSTVRSLHILGNYLKYRVNKGDLLVIDEPELNLHPKNQRLLARLFVRLIHVGIKVLISTHSDYLIKELNTLIMLNDSDKKVKKRIQSKYGYVDNELLPQDKTALYMTKQLTNNHKEEKTNYYTLERAKTDSEVGFYAKSFDETIDIMNTIQDDILFSDE